MSNYFWIIDAGHGGMTPDGHYTTAPGKMHVFDDGLTFYEGVNNRAIAAKLIAALRKSRIGFAPVYDAVLDTPLRDRVSAANRLHALGKRCIYLSIHSDAMPEGFHGRGSGFSIYTCRGQTPADGVAAIFCDAYDRDLGEFRFREDRSDGDADNEEDFYVLRHTHCPALLVENLFFDNRVEAEFLLSATGQERIARTLFSAILTTERRRPV